jgi:NAD(P)-dependent dehydrogenase (short-subunit alcohol dehydrogenase family)
MEAGAWSAVVTGVGAGIGRAIFERLLADGWSVVGLELDPSLAEQGQERCSEAGLRGHILTGDAGDRGALREAREVATGLAPLGGWVNNAAVVAQGTLHDADPDLVSRLFKVNVEGYFWGCAEAVTTFMAQRTSGAIVNISSLQARSAFPGWAAYDTSKAAVYGLTRYVAVEYGAAGIRANAVEPGAILTPWNEDMIARSADPAAQQAQMEGFSVFGRLGRSPEIASVVSFLLSDEASFVTGASIPVDGGATARIYPFPTHPAVLPPINDPPERRQVGDPGRS